jgi:shikimate kinase
MILLRPLSVNGLKHVGKSSVSRMVAENLGYNWFDTDETILSLAGEMPEADCGSIRDVYRSVGRRVFQELEYRSLQRIVARVHTDRQRAVISTGGGICDNTDAFLYLQEHTVMVFLDENPEILYERIARRGIPAYLDPDRPYDHFMELAAKRRSTYRSGAHRTLQVAGLTLPEIASTVTGIFDDKEQPWQETVSDRPFA